MVLASDQAVLGIFARDQFSALVLIAIFTAGVFVMIQRARAGVPIPGIRKLPGIEALEEAVGRSTEMGKPVHYVPGLGDIRDPMTIASFGVLGYVARMAARYDVRLIQTNRNAVVYSICEEIVRQGYLEAGRPDSFNPDDIRFMSEAQFAYCANVVGMLEREKPAAQILYGNFWAEAMIIIEQGALIGSIQIGATAQVHQLPWFVACCDYCLMGDEMYAASAYLSKEPIMTGTVVGQDLGKYLCFLLIVLGVILSTITGSTDHFLTQWLR